MSHDRQELQLASKPFRQCVRRFNWPRVIVPINLYVTYTPNSSSRVMSEAMGTGSTESRVGHRGRYPPQVRGREETASHRKIYKKFIIKKSLKRDKTENRGRGGGGGEIRQTSKN